MDQSSIYFIATPTVRSRVIMSYILGPATLNPTLVNTTEEQLAGVGSSDMTYEYKVSLAVEIPLIFLAVTAVSLRVFSRIGIKKQLAVDDVLIIIGTVRVCGHSQE
jgi:hypothetical protein